MYSFPFLSQEVAQMPAVVNFCQREQGIIIQLTVLILISLPSIGQERQHIPVVIDGEELSMDWNGGFNAPQFSNIDHIKTIKWILM